MKKYKQNKEWNDLFTKINPSNNKSQSVVESWEDVIKVWGWKEMFICPTCGNNLTEEDYFHKTRSVGPSEQRKQCIKCLSNPGINNKSFNIKFDSDFMPTMFDLSKNSISDILDAKKLQVLEKPYKKWYKYLFQIITFGIYKAPYQYKCKLK